MFNLDFVYLVVILDVTHIKVNTLIKCIPVRIPVEFLKFDSYVDLISEKILI